MGGISGTSFSFRFDNDATNDCNIFEFENGNYEHLGFGYDGPNNDGDTDTVINGRHTGVVLAWHVYACKQGVPHTRFYLFKQHGVSAQECKVMRAKPALNAYGWALEYQGFPYMSEPVVSYRPNPIFALASKKRFMFGTQDESKIQHLHLFEYECQTNETDVKA